MKRCKIYRDEQFCGHVSSTDEQFYGLKAHALMAESGISAELFLSPGSYADVSALCDFSFQRSSGIVIYGGGRVTHMLLKMKLSSQIFI